MAAHTYARGRNEGPSSNSRYPEPRDDRRDDDRRRDEPRRERSGRSHTYGRYDSHRRYDSYKPGDPSEQQPPRDRERERDRDRERDRERESRSRSPYRSSNNNNRVASAFSIPSPPRQPRVEPRGDSRRGYDTYRAPAHVIPCIDEDTLPTPPRTSAPRPPYDALQRNVKVAREAPTVQSAYHAMASKYGEVTMVKLGNDEGTFAYVHFRYHREAGRCVAARQDTNWSTRVVTEEMGDSDWVDVRRGGARGYGGGRRGGRGREWRGNQGGNWGWGGPAPRERDDWRMDNRDDRGGEDDVPVRPHRESPPPDRADLDEI